MKLCLKSFGRICNINAIYNIFPDGDSNPNPQNSSQADKYLTNMAVTDPTKERDTVRLLLKRSCLSPGGTRHQPCQYKPAPVQKSTQYPGHHVPVGAERTCFVNSLNSSRHATRKSFATFISSSSEYITIKVIQRTRLLTFLLLST